MAQNKLSHDEIIAVLAALSQGTLDQITWLSEPHRDAIDTIRISDPESIILAFDLATSGSAESRKAITAFFSKLILVHLNSARVLEFQPGYDYDMLSLPSNTASVLNGWLFHWNFHNVIEETGNQNNGYDPDSIDLFAPLLSPMRVKHDSSYWRGVSVVLFSTDEWSKLDLSNHEEFILWAGQHTDINAVITTARERNTLDPEILRFLIDESGVHSRLRTGAL